MKASDTNIEYLNFEEIKKSIARLETDNIVIVTEPNIWSKYGEFFKGLTFENKILHHYKLPSGEACKTFIEFERCIQFLISKKVHREAHLVAIGGGALSDLTGFVASSYLRGISWSVVPTTLLSMIDACLGGKVAINVNETKNMVGAFHHPANIFINHQFLTTLPSEEIKSAMGEVAKYALLDKKIFEKVITRHPVESIIEDCLNYKKDIVVKDPKEKELRRLLNLGHTLGHAIEHHYKLSHGTSVFWGMVVESILFECTDTLNKLSELNRKLNITNGEPPWLNRTFPKDDLIQLIESDKKVISNKDISLPIAKNNEVTLTTVALADVDEKIGDKIEFIRKYKL